jgi:hypothetical protein
MAIIKMSLDAHLICAAALKVTFRHHNGILRTEVLRDEHLSIARSGYDSKPPFAHRFSSASRIRYPREGRQASGRGASRPARPQLSTRLRGRPRLPGLRGSEQKYLYS